MKEKRGLLTVGIGKKYAGQAKYLALSSLIKSPNTLRAVITDYPEQLKKYYDIVIPYDKEFDDPFLIKTRLCQYSPFEKTLFVDADSLIVSSVDGYWEFLDNQTFAYHGKLLHDGVWYLDIKKTIGQFNLPWFPQLNSGMLLFDDSEKSRGVFETAYHFMKNQRDENINIDYFRGTFYPDEPFIALALAKHGVKPVDDHARFSRTLIDVSNVHLDILKRIALYSKDEKAVFPHIVHFCGRFGNLIYRREKIRLFFYFNPPLFTLFIAFLALIRKAFKKPVKKSA
jgi:hypothetical protein